MQKGPESAALSEGGAGGVDPVARAPRRVRCRLKLTRPPG